MIMLRCCPSASIQRIITARPRPWAYKAGDRRPPGEPERRDHTRRFADLAAAVAKLSARTLVFDGEVVI
jgi:hypothetical protein